MEHATSIDARPLLCREDIAAFLPERGAFTFPAPYNTPGIRITNASDGAILPVGYSYWRNINQHGGRPSLLVFLGAADGHPLLFEVDKATGSVTPRGPIGSLRGTAEGWYFSATVPTALYLPMQETFVRFDVETQAAEPLFSVGPGRLLWQMSSSDDDEVHAGTVKDADYKDVGVVVHRRGTTLFLEIGDGYDECQLDKTGRWLVIKEGAGGADNRIVDLDTGEERTLRNQDGAVGHSDTGAGVVIGEDDQHEPGALVAWDLAGPLTPESRRLLYHLTQWDTGLGHVSVRGDRILVSHAHRLGCPRVNELVLVSADGSLQSRAVAPNMVDMGCGPGSDYEKLPKANLDPLGEYACWTANCGGDRFDAFLVQL